MTYRINIENTGLATFEEVKMMADLLRDKGYDVEATRDLEWVNSGDTVNPFQGGKSKDDWTIALMLCDRS